MTPPCRQTCSLLESTVNQSQSCGDSTGSLYYNVYMRKTQATATDVMTVRLPSELKERFEQLAQATSRSKSWLATDAIRHYLEIEEWQIQGIKMAIEEADRGDFASPEEVQKVFSRWIP
jgi:RHH-type transcriptional regulator, rel operon repressor / antitoxin RelB